MPTARPVPGSPPGGLASPPSRVRRFRAILDERDCSHAVVSGADHVLHLSGYTRFLGAPSAVVIGPDAERTLVVARYELAAAEAGADVEAIVTYGGEDFLDPAPVQTMASVCIDQVRASRLALAGEPEVRSAFEDDSRSTVDVEPHLTALRRVKDPDELDRIREAFELTLAGQRIVEESWYDGQSEIELWTAAIGAAQEGAGLPIQHVGVLASGANTAFVPHAADSTRVTSGGLVLSDIAVRHHGYWGDSSRTFTDDDDVLATRDVLMTILEETVRGLRPGRRVSEIFAEMQASITSRLPGSTLPHHGGHGIGIGAGEVPKIVPSDDSIVEAGMVFAIEPGAYWPGNYGVRVENTYVVHPSGAEIVTKGAGSTTAAERARRDGSSPAP